MWTTLPEQSTVSWEDKTPGRATHGNTLHKMGSQKASRLCYLCLQHKLLERVHDSKKDMEKWKRIEKGGTKKPDLEPGDLAFEWTQLEVFDRFYLIQRKQR